MRRFVVTLVVGACVGVTPSEDIFKASENIESIINFVDTFNREEQVRNIEVLDFFAGEANLWRRGRHRGLNCQTYDILLDKEQDILTYSGFFLGLLLCCQAQEMSKGFKRLVKLYLRDFPKGS